ncbi:UPF0598 protein CG30010 [Manduca sexta]|uniref:Uncharacterized protein n=1 Tax=Manduca sexta TaxID=7130 RepID=A0A921ZA00_MANSE|nr:UPF0598 protein CG30010 [Manduca sexta]KAG6454051.1 hypothetical protein O3G_MSEX008471 [Manduca sexta]
MKFSNTKFYYVLNQNIKYLLRLSRGQERSLSYVQGQEPEPKVREYFYYIDHQGMLFLDDSKMKNFTSCFKEKKFLEFFFKRIRMNTTGRYADEFPFVSLCGRERNYIRCDDLPIVYTHIINKCNTDFLTYGYAGDLLSTEFIPQQIYMLPLTGRVYHPAEDRYGGIGLIKSKLAIELSKNFEFQNGEAQPPTHFVWKNNKYELDQDWFQEKIKQYNLKINTTISD